MSLKKRYLARMETPTREQQLQWVRQYKAAAIALEEVHYEELRALTDEEALRQSDAVLSLPPTWRHRPDWSGLVEQQAWFHRRSPK